MTPPSQQPIDASIQQLRTDLNGKVIGADDPGYDEARSVFLSGFDRRRPAAVVHVADSDDVSRVVSVAREAASSSRCGVAATAPPVTARPTEGWSSTCRGCGGWTSMPASLVRGPDSMPLGAAQFEGSVR